MQKFISITDNPGNGLKRKALLENFLWKIHDDKIEVYTRAYYVKNNGDLDGSIPFNNKKLTVDDEDKINLLNGSLIEKSTYDEAIAAHNADPENIPNPYPNVVGQHTAMMGMSIEDMMELIGFSGVKQKLSDAGITEFKTALSQALLKYIEINIIDSANRGKYDQ